MRRMDSAVCRALEAAGVEFIVENGGGPGLRLAAEMSGMEHRAREILSGRVAQSCAPILPS
jgi:hypothetical protein